MPEFRMIEFSRPADREDGKQSGWVALVDEQGAELWRGWVSPVRLDLWGAMQDACRPDPEAAWCGGIRISEPGPDGRYVAARCGSTSTHGGHWLDDRDERPPGFDPQDQPSEAGSLPASANCVTCGPTRLEAHPRLAGVQRCSNCKEGVLPEQVGPTA